MKKESYWLATAKTAHRKRALHVNIDTEDLVIGGGITGVTTALLLQRAGRKVCLVERDEMGGAETGHTTAHLTYMTDTRLSDLVSTFGEAHALASWDAGAAAMEQIQKLADEIPNGCDLHVVPGFLAAFKDTPDRKKETDQLTKEAHMVVNHGFDVDHINCVPVTGMPRHPVCQPAKVSSHQVSSWTGQARRRRRGAHF